MAKRIKGFPGRPFEFPNSLRKTSAGRNRDSGTAEGGGLEERGTAVETGEKGARKGPWHGADGVGELGGGGNGTGNSHRDWRLVLSPPLSISIKEKQGNCTSVQHPV